MSDAAPYSDATPIAANGVDLENLCNRIRNAGLMPPDRSDILPFAHIKRFMERWAADAQFRAFYPGDPARVLKGYGLQVEPEEVRTLWQESAERRSGGEVAAHAPRVQRFLAYDRQLFQHRDGERRRAVPSDPRFAAWRQRQIYRTNLEVGLSLPANPHLAASLELSRGCSVGCWFCSSTPPELSDLFRYTPQNAGLWQELLETIRAVAGPAASATTICYSGTDPFDNPDYERFFDDFARVNGDVPYTSTALAVRDLARTRKFISLCGPNRLRLSVLSLGMLNKIHAVFPAEELLLVQLGFRNEGALENRFMNFAGRARQHEKMYRKYRRGSALISTPSCETGFKFNLPDRVIRLSSPCAPDDRWPKGYRVYDEARFHDGNSARRIIENMIARHMPLEVSETATLQFHRSLQYEQTPFGFSLTTGHLKQRFENSPEIPYMGRLGALVQSGRHSAEQMLETLRLEQAAPSELVSAAIHEFYRLGLFDDEPSRDCGETLTAISPSNV